MRTRLALVLLLAVLVGPAGSAGSAVLPSPAAAPVAYGPPRSRSAPGVVTYRAPVLPLRVLRGFSPPATRYGAGHLGVDLAAAGPVRAAGAGTVTFAGSVAGRGLVVVLHADGIRTEYEPLRPLVRRGQQVAAGAVLGSVSGTHRGCPGSCLHWGARRGDAYLDPLSLLRPLGPVRLLPWSASSGGS